jgi:hypothetical protein
MDVINTPFNAVLDRTREEVSANASAVAHFVTFDPETREVHLAHADDYNAAPAGERLIYRFERDGLSPAGFREAWNQAKTDVLRAVVKRDKRFAHLG